MPARAIAKIFDTTENRLAVALQNGMTEQILVGRARTTAASAVNVNFEPVNHPDFNGTTGGRIKIPEGTSVAFRGLVVCANATDDPATSLNYGNAYEFSGVIRNLNGVTALPVAGVTVTALDTTASHALPAANVVVTADDTNDLLNIAVTGVAAKTHYWRVFLTINSVSFFG
jgi:hypothetical protein